VDGEYTALKLTNTSVQESDQGAVAIAFDLHESTTGGVVDAAKIIVDKKQNFTSTGSTQNALMKIDLSKSGAMTNVITIDGEHGNVGIGDTAPGALLHIKADDDTAFDATSTAGEESEYSTGATIILENKGTGGAGIAFAVDTDGDNALGRIVVNEDSGNDAVMHFCLSAADTAATRMKILQNGAVYMPYYGNGDVTFAGGTGLLATSSDERLKENITTLTDGLSLVNKLNPVYYTWKEKEPSGKDNIMYVDDAPNGGKELGFIAQQVGAVLPQFSPDWGKDDEQWRGIQNRAIIAALTKAIQELSAKVEALENA